MFSACNPESRAEIALATGSVPIRSLLVFSPGFHGRVPIDIGVSYEIDITLDILDILDDRFLFDCPMSI